MNFEVMDAGGSDGAEFVNETLLLGPTSEINFEFEVQFDDIVGSNIHHPT